MTECSNIIAKQWTLATKADNIYPWEETTFSFYDLHITQSLVDGPRI